MCFGYSFTLQVAKESIAARMLAYVIDSYDKCEEYRSCNARILQSQRCPDFHNLSVSMKPIPALV